MSDAERVETPEVSFSLSGERITLRDEAGGGEVAVELDGDTSLTRATTSWFDVPMDAAVSFETESLRTTDCLSAAVRGHDGEHHGNVTSQPFSLTADGTFLDISASLKTLVYVERGTITGYLESVGTGEMEAIVFEFDEPTRVVVGARSFHEQPTATMTVPDDPDALMEAVSHLGASIKEWSAERSWPTLRGHPPAIEAGAALHLPDRLSKPETGVTVAVPPETASILRVAPLAHYLGAAVVPGDRAALRLDGHTESLGAGGALERSVDELLARCVLLDSLVRIGGYYSNPRYEYDELAPELPFYPPALYDEPVAEQLREYLEVPYDTLEPFVPRWPATATLRPTVADAEALPSLLNSMARVRVTADGRPRASEQATDSSAALSTASAVPRGTAFLPEAGRQRMASWERGPGADASVLFVGTQPSAVDRFERVKWAEFDVGAGTPTATHRPAVTRAELRAALGGTHLYVHYGNRVTPEGFVCSDGVLGFDELPNGAVGAVSFAWGGAELEPLTRLFDATTVACLPPEPPDAATVARFATLLTLGYSPAQGSRLTEMGENARFLGDVSTALAERPCGHPPPVFTVTDAEDGRYHVSVYCPMSHDDALGWTVALFPRECHDVLQLGNTTTAFAEPVTFERLTELHETGAVIRFADALETESSLRGSGTVFDTL